MSGRVNIPLFVSIAPPTVGQRLIIKSDATKAYPLGEGPKQTRGGGQVWLQKPAAKKEKKEPKIYLGTAPGAGPTKVPTSKAQKSLQLIDEMMGVLR
jgi:hypothetical protein